MKKPTRPKLPKRPKGNAPVASWEKYAAKIDESSKVYAAKIKSYAAGIAKRESIKKTVTKKVDMMKSK
jgi:hypothetical protein